MAHLRTALRARAGQGLGLRRVRFIRLVRPDGLARHPRLARVVASASPSSSPSPSDSSSDPEDEKAKSDKSPESADSTSRDQRSGSSPSATPESGETDNSQQGDDSSALTDTGSGRHRGPSADEALPSGSDRADESAGRHASRGDEGSGAGSADTRQGDYIVGVGDSLWSIADALDVSGGWHALYDGNEKAVGADPNLIHPGQKLTVEGEGDEK